MHHVVLAESFHVSPEDLDQILHREVVLHDDVDPPILEGPNLVRVGIPFFSYWLAADPLDVCVVRDEDPRAPC